MKHFTTDHVYFNNIAITAPWQWLQKGWQDFTQGPLIGLSHGIAVSAFGFILLIIAYDQFWLLAGAFTGFLVVAPLVAVGLYTTSRDIENVEPVSFKHVFQIWRSWRGPPHDWRLIRFGLLLSLSGTGWVLTSAAFITLFSPHPIHQPLDFLQHIVLSSEHLIFEIWWLLGISLAIPMYASSVITLPLLLDRKIPLMNAVLASWKVVLQNPIPMAIWAIVIASCAFIGLITLFGSIIIIPVLGHASWHAYRDTVNANQLPLRTHGDT